MNDYTVSQEFIDFMNAQEDVREWILNHKGQPIPQYLLNQLAIAEQKYMESKQ